VQAALDGLLDLIGRGINLFQAEPLLEGGDKAG
jgi:hypothetical protein